MPMRGAATPALGGGVTIDTLRCRVSYEDVVCLPSGSTATVRLPSASYPYVHDIVPCAPAPVDATRATSATAKLRRIVIAELPWIAEDVRGRRMRGFAA